MTKSDRRQTLIDSLKASKGWTTGYATAFVDTFGDQCASRAVTEKTRWENLVRDKKDFDRYPWLLA